MLYNYFAGAFNMNADQVIATGGSCCLSTFDVGTNYVSDTTNPSAVLYMRNACKDIMYTVVNSNAYASDTAITLTAWVKLMIAIDIIVGALLIFWEVLLMRNYKKRKK